MKVEIGDPVEYKIWRNEVGNKVCEKWIPATVICFDSYQICVQDANNIRRAIPFKSNEWRKV